jgi:hypothetical protein
MANSSISALFLWISLNRGISMRARWGPARNRTPKVAQKAKVLWLLNLWVAGRLDLMIRRRDIGPVLAPNLPQQRIRLGLPTTWYANALVAGQWFLMLSLTINTGASTSTPYTLTAINSTGTGTPTITLYSFPFTTAANVTRGQAVTILYGVGSTTWTAPAALTFTVA